MAVTPARRRALAVLRACRSGELADRALARAFDALKPRDRPWLQELVYGTLRLRGRLDHLLEGVVRRGLASLEADVLDILRLGAYQLFEMESVPAYAAISQSVALARSEAGGGAAALVNGVLRALDREPPPFPDFERDPVAYLETYGSHPVWLVERWVRRFGADAARALVEANNRRPELYLRPLGLDPADAVERLGRAGIAAELVPFAPDAIRLAPPASAAEALAVVPAVVQDPAAGLVVRYTAPPAGARIADLCAAPGGKALALADGAGYVAAADLSQARLLWVRENAARVPALEIGLVAADARWPPFRPVDVVLVDVPCTGTGTLRRHPDGKWRLGPGDLATLAALQREILAAAAEVVAPGGLLVYSTCSLEPEENEEQVDAFLEGNAEFVLEPPPVGRIEARLLDVSGRLRVLPQETGVDGAFAARLRRRG
ncbi:MAG TPA: 16S rRNA (cytosine(967)-C(5))-methyltransferase RsmB [Longimicrobiales bacterium]